MLDRLLLAPHRRFSAHEVAGLSDVGKKRPRNEDYLVVAPEYGLFIVADGVGGQRSGGIAARMSAELVRGFIAAEHEQLTRAATTSAGREYVLKRLERAVIEAHEAVVSAAASTASQAGMATTLSVLWVFDGWAAIAHVGDSRIYRYQPRLSARPQASRELAAPELAVPQLGVPQLAVPQLGVEGLDAPQPVLRAAPAPLMPPSPLRPSEPVGSEREGNEAAHRADTLRAAPQAKQLGERLRCCPLERLTSDHSIVGELLEGGFITEAEARVNPFRSVLTRAVGNTREPLRVEVRHLTLNPGDGVLLCSDGVYRHFTDDELAERVAFGGPREIVERLVDEANARGGHDNATAVFVTIGERGSGLQPIVRSPSA